MPHSPPLSLPRRSLRSCSGPRSPIPHPTKRDVPRLSFPLCAVTRFRRGSASPRDASLAPLSLPRRSLRSCSGPRSHVRCYRTTVYIALRSIRLSHVPPLSLRRSPHALAAYTRLTTTLSTRRPSPQTRRTVHRPRDLSAKALPPPHRSLRSHRGELAGPLSRDDVHATGAQCSCSARHRCGRSPLVLYAPLGTYSMAPPTTTRLSPPLFEPRGARLPLVCFVLVLVC